MMFYKYHGLGNDFIIIDELSEKHSYQVLAKSICNRYTGIGADGLIVSRKHQEYFEMLIFNSDGSEAKMCGNGLRCYAKFLFDRELQTKKDFQIKTKAGLMRINVSSLNPFLAEVNMGKPVFDTSSFGISIDSDTYINQALVVNQKKLYISTILMNVEHSVLFGSFSKDEILTLGKLIENHKQYPDRTNVNFVEIENKNEVNLRTYERGAGLTLACGTGACASVVVGNKLNLLSNQVTVHLPLGNLKISLREAEVFMEGPAEYICKGEYK